MRKKILITGSNGKLANRIISILKKKDYFIIGCDKFNSNLKGLDFFKKVNLISEKEVDSFLKEIVKKNLIPDIIINNAAIDSVPSDKKISDGLNYDEFDDIFKVNVKSPLIISNFLIKCWIKNKIKGRIINISSIYSEVSPDPNIYQKGFIKNILYGASKSSLNNISRQLAVIFSSNNILVNSICFSGIKSEIQNDEFIKNYSNRIPIKRLMNLEEIDSVINFLIDEKNTYTTGSIINVDGGYTSI
jgi:NAD(P)-dependent dehydrogenase (short-subunit alcohol dehydrogenase family)